MNRTKLGGIALTLLSLTASAQSTSWRYYRPGNTGIQGDYCESVWIGADGDPWIGGYEPSFEEGGVSKLIQAENRWFNLSNVDYPVIGHPDLTGTTRVSDIELDAQGRMWFATWRGALRYDPAVGPSSLVNYASASTALKNGGCRDMAIAPDGTIWFALVGFGGSVGGLLRYTPAINDWHYWTGGSVPQGGNNWPMLVWAVRSVNVQPKPAGGYVVWADSENGSSILSFDSSAQVWVDHPFSYTVDSLYEIPGKGAVDASGNLWAVRFAGFDGSSATFNLDYQKPDGTWISPPQPTLAAVNPAIWAFRAYGNGEALLADGNSRILHFDGSTWQDFGVWRQGAYTYDLRMDGPGAVWVCGTGGAAKRNPVTGAWQRYRVTNTSQYDYWANDLSLDSATGRAWVCANAGPGFGGATMFDGVRWTGINDATYGLGLPWPFPTDNSESIAFRPSTGQFAVNPMFNGLHQWTGSSWQNLNGMTVSEGLLEDSLGRLWSLGEYFSLAYHDGNAWTSVPNNGTWGNNIQRDPDRPGTVWVSTYAEVQRTDGSYKFSRDYTQFPELNTQHDIFSTVAAGPNGTAWLGSTAGMFHLDANTGTYQYFTSLGGISCVGASPLAVTPDGRVWYAMFDSFGSGPHGLVWFDGTTAGIFSAPKDGGPQWGGLPHAQIYALQQRVIPGGYELWMSCASRGLAVLTVLDDGIGTLACTGDSGPCPCGNASAPTDASGCVNSTGKGAALRGFGSTSVTADNLTLSVGSVPPLHVGMVFMGSNAVAPIPFGDGLRCASGSIFRFAAGNSGAGGSLVAGPGLVSYSTSHNPPAGWILAGSTWSFQGWHRDPNGPCGNGHNVSNSLTVSFTP